MAPEAWLRGPVAGIDPYLMPAAHALVQCREELAAAARDLTKEQLWARPGGAASVGFHLRHVAGSLDRLLTYARGEALTDVQRRAAGMEGTPGDDPDPSALLLGVSAAVDSALARLRETGGATLLEPRAVGRAGLPSTVLGLIFHAAEHAQRHTGQVIVTSKVVRALIEG
jgi:DinB superfamily